MLNQVLTELSGIPRGDLAQNLYRSAYEQARLNGLGRQPEIGPTATDAHAAALRIVRRQFPGFTPVLRYVPGACPVAVSSAVSCNKKTSISQ